MRLLKKILIIVFVFFVIAYASGYVFLIAYGKRIIVEQLHNYLGKDVSVGTVTMSSPWKFIIHDIQIDGIGQVASVELSPSVLGLISGKIVLYNVLVKNPTLMISRQAPAQAEQPGKPSEQIDPGQKQAGQELSQTNNLNHKVLSGQKSNGKPSVIFYKLQVTGGTLVYRDMMAAGDNGGVKIVCSNINAVVSNVYESFDEIVTKFEVSSQIPWNTSKESGKINLDGWVNFFKKDMRAKLVMSDIDALSLYPYYSDWFNLDKTNIQQAKLAFTSNVTGLNNDVVAACHLELTEIGFKQREENESESRAERIAHKVLDFIKAVNDGKVVLDFSIKTKMDSPDFGMNVVKSAFENTIMRARKGEGTTTDKVIAVPGKVVKGTVKGISDVSTALIGGVVSFGKEIGKSLGASFRKESSPAVIQPESVTKSLPVVKNETVVEPETVIKPELAVEPESVIQSGNVTKSETVNQSESVIKSESAVQSGPDAQAGNITGQKSEIPPADTGDVHAAINSTTN